MQRQPERAMWSGKNIQGTTRETYIQERIFRDVQGETWPERIFRDIQGYIWSGKNIQGQSESHIVWSE
jgi:hypothetical protein